MRTRILEADPDLGRNLPPDSVTAMNPHLVADVLELPVGDWSPERTEPHPGHLGYLVLDGLILRRTELNGARSGELISRGDLIRPWLEEPISFSNFEWRVMEPARLAVLDRRLAARLCARPELSAALLDRLTLRTRSLAIHAATENMRGLEDRLITLFWHLAERWGRREQNTVVVPIHLTHETLSLLVGARRPSVTTSLGVLAERGALERRGDGAWVLHGLPPTVGD
ncbi:MAG TPA: Crp/Fnr family transcriptional regulator [Solirubrobacterales bacterium]|nr:Crp/Fnr family transcriptional regulator [Solirubrobacterales bacterium]